MWWLDLPLFALSLSLPAARGAPHGIFSVAPLRPSGPASFAWGDCWARSDGPPVWAACCAAITAAPGATGSGASASRPRPGPRVIDVRPGLSALGRHQPVSESSDHPTLEPVGHCVRRVGLCLAPAHRGD